MTRFQPLPGLHTQPTCPTCNQPIEPVWTREPLALRYNLDPGPATRTQALTAIAHNRGGALLTATIKRPRGQGTTLEHIHPTATQLNLDTTHGYTWRRIHHCNNPPLHNPNQPQPGPAPARHWPDQPPF
jgi:hypothetical protein